LVDDGLAQQAHLQLARRREKVLELLEPEAGIGEVAEEHALVAQKRVGLNRLGRGEQKVRQLGRRERLAFREMNPAAVALDQRLFLRDVRGLVEQQIRILWAFD